ncbi:MAG: hypothetical protein VYE08_00465, partial [Candidatus Thermoplasmatota archaeon]|nr:hypothetical protein [Candidatus Thermoplasmatota archaeon]
EVAVEGGWFPTLLRGPRLNVTFHRRDGTTTTETMAPALTVRHTQPWDDSGIDGKGTYPIEHVRKVLFGNAAPFSWEGVQRGSTSGEGSEETGEVEKDPLADFEVGGTYTGTVVKHMHGKADGVFFGYLVVLKERQVKGLLHANKMVGKSQTMLDMMYAKGNPIRVKILSIRGPDRIELDFADEDESE